jgi:hypothetical protein
VAAHVAVNSVMFMLSVANVKKWLRIWSALDEIATAQMALLKRLMIGNDGL